MYHIFDFFCGSFFLFQRVVDFGLLIQNIFVFLSLRRDSCLRSSLSPLILQIETGKNFHTKEALSRFPNESLLLPMVKIDCTFVLLLLFSLLFLLFWDVMSLFKFGAKSDSKLPKSKWRTRGGKFRAEAKKLRKSG